MTERGRFHPRILIVGGFPSDDRAIFGGIVTSCRALINSSLPSRAELVLVDTTQITNPAPPLPVRALLAVRRFVRYVRSFEGRRPDVIILFTAVGASVLDKGVMAWYARLRGVPVLMFPRGGGVIDSSKRSRFMRIWIRQWFRGADAILCQGPSWHRFAVGSLGFQPEDAPTIPNWTATPEMLSIGRNRNVSEGPVVRLLFLGWVKREKGVFELIEAFGRLAASHHVTLDIVGEGSASAAARELVIGKKLSSLVTFHGWRTGRELEQLLAGADVLVLPSWAEGFPNAMIEAMAARMAVVVTGVGNVPDIVTSGREALVVPPKDVNALHLALEQVIINGPLRRRLANAGFALAEREFSVEPAVDRILLAVTNVLSPK